MYRVLVNGRNFLIEWDGSVQKCGFYVTRFVNAEGKESAESEAILSLRSDTHLQELTKNEQTDPPLLFIEEIERVSDNNGAANNTGFSWYDE